MVNYNSILSQGAANRKVAATNMNRASSRSHSVFTCVIESKVCNCLLSYFLLFQYLIFEPPILFRHFCLNLD